MEELGKLISEDTIIQFMDGTQIKGSKEVAKFLIDCCKSYNKGYMEALKRNGIKGAIVGMVLVGTGIAINEMIKHRNKEIEA